VGQERIILKSDGVVDGIGRGDPTLGTYTVGAEDVVRVAGLGDSDARCMWRQVLNRGSSWNHCNSIPGSQLPSISSVGKNDTTLRGRAIAITVVTMDQEATSPTSGQHCICGWS